MTEFGLSFDRETGSKLSSRIYDEMAGHCIVSFLLKTYLETKEKSTVDARQPDAAVDKLLAGELVAIPTETVYGLAADATNADAVAKVFQLKGRPLDHPLIVHCFSAEQAWNCASLVCEEAKLLAAAFWPGPLTLVLPRSELISPAVTGGQDSVALRVPSHPLTLELLRQMDRPLVAPSANLFGRVSPTTAEHVRNEFENTEIMILDGGDCQIGIESTIIDCREAGRVKVLRPGKISETDIAKVIGAKSSISDQSSITDLRVSGNLPSHYAPEAKVVLVEKNQWDVWLKSAPAELPPTLLIGPRPPRTIPNGSDWQTIPADPEIFARQIYGLLRNADQKGIQQVVIELPDDQGIGTAIRDRLYRAAGEKT